VYNDFFPRKEFTRIEKRSPRRGVSILLIFRNRETERGWGGGEKIKENSIALR
jgi:hypothetical protein